MDKKRKTDWDILMKAWNDGKIACHLYHAQKYVSTYPDDMYGYMALADVLAGLALYDDARRALRESLKLCPEGNEYQVYTQLGHLYKEKCDLKRAEKWYRKAVEVFPRQESYIFLGACLAKQGQFSEAKKSHQKAVRKAPETADEAYFNLGLIYRAEGKYKKALKCLNKAIEIDPKYEEAKFEWQDIQEVLKILMSDNN